MPPFITSASDTHFGFRNKIACIRIGFDRGQLLEPGNDDESCRLYATKITEDAITAFEFLNFFYICSP